MKLRLPFRCPGSMLRFLVAVTMIGVIGCGGSTTVLTGVVTLDGSAVPDAAVEFFPISGPGKVSFTKTDSAGHYRANVAATKLAVVITATKVDGKMKNPIGGGELVDRVVSVVPERYSRQDQTPLIIDPVSGKTTTIDLTLESSPAARTEGHR